MQNYRSTRRSCYVGYITQAIACNLAPIFYLIFQNTFDITRTQIGQIVLVLFLVQLVVDLLSVLFIKKLGERGTCLLAHASATAGLILMSFLPFIMDPFAGIMLAVVLVAIGSGLIEVMISPIVNALPKDDSGKDSMALLHSFYCWGQAAVVLITTLALRLIGGDHWNLLPLFWAIIPGANFFAFLRVPLVKIDGDEPLSLRDFVKNPVFYLSFILMICSGVSEQAMSQWASYFAEAGLGVTKVMGDLLGPCLFAILMAIGRVGYALLGDRLDLSKCLAVCGCVAVISYLTAVFSPYPILSLFGCAACGFGVSLLWPGMLSLSAERFPNGGSTLFALLALGGDIGCSTGPFLTGIVSDAVTKNETLLRFAEDHAISTASLGVKAGLLSVIVFPLTMVIGVLLLRKAKNK